MYFVTSAGVLPIQDAIRKRAGAKIEGGKIIKIEAHPIPENYRPKRVVGRMSLVGDAAGYVTKCSGEGIYFAAKSGRMAAEAVVQCIKQTGKLPTEKQMKQTYIKDYDKLYKPTYLVLDLLQKVSCVIHHNFTPKSTRDSSRVCRVKDYWSSKSITCRSTTLGMKTLPFGSC